MLKQRWIGVLFDLIVHSLGALRVGRAAAGSLAMAIAVAGLVHVQPVLRAPAAWPSPFETASDAASPAPAEAIAAALAAWWRMEASAPDTSTTDEPGPRDPDAPAADVVVAPVPSPRIDRHALAHEEPAVPLRAAPRLNREQTNIARFIARRYQVAIDEVQHFVDFAYKAAGEVKLDPMLILAVISVESSFDPGARSPAGAQGLMQVLTRVHAEKFAPFGGVAAAFDPLANIRVGARILREYVVRLGSVEAALKSYVGAAIAADDAGYGNKVLQEREKLAAAAAGRPIPKFERPAPAEPVAVRVSDGPAREADTVTPSEPGGWTPARAVPIGIAPDMGS